MKRKDEIAKRISDKPWLTHIHDSVHEVPQRLEEYDKDLFVVWNCRDQQYEIHSLANIGNTFGLGVPFGTLDARIVESVKRYDARVRGADKIIKEMDEANDRLTEKKMKDRKSELNDIAREMAPAFKKLAWEGV